VPAGKYKVTLTRAEYALKLKSTNLDAHPISEKLQNADPKTLDASLVDFHSMIDKKFGNRITTPLEIKVSSSEKSFTLDAGPVIHH